MTDWIIRNILGCYDVVKCEVLTDPKQIQGGWEYIIKPEKSGWYRVTFWFFKRKIKC